MPKIVDPFERRQRRGAYMKAYRKEQYEARKSNGICTRCGRNDSFRDHVMCKPCLEEVARGTARRKAMPKDLLARQFPEA